MKTYKTCHKCYETNKNKLVNLEYIVRVFKNIIISQLGIKICEIQNLCRQELRYMLGELFARGQN